jgi:hypothetical protein
LLYLVYRLACFAHATFTRTKCTKAAQSLTMGLPAMLCTVQFYIAKHWNVDCFRPAVEKEDRSFRAKGLKSCHLSTQNQAANAAFSSMLENNSAFHQSVQPGGPWQPVCDLPDLRPAGDDMAADSLPPRCTERATALAQHVWSGRACTGQTRWWPAARLQSVVQARPCAPSGPG